MHELRRGLPRNIIERVNDMTDDEVSHYPDVLSAVAELAVIEEAMAKRQDQKNAIRTKVERIDPSIADLTQQIEAIAAARPALALAIFEGISEDELDRTTQGELADLQRRREKLELE